MGRAALGVLVTGGAPAAPGFDVALESVRHEGAPPAGSLAAHARARHRRTGRVDEAEVVARAGRRATFEVAVDGERMTLADLGDDARSAIVMEALPSLVAEAHDLDVARLIRVAARDVPPDRDTPTGVARRAMLTRVVAGLLSPAAGALSDEAVHVATDLVEAADLPAAAPERREIEELVWSRLSEAGEAGASAALRGLALKLGFSAEAFSARGTNENS